MTVRAVLIDLSGTLHVGDLAIPGAVRALQQLRQLPGVRVLFVTNTTKESSTRLLQRLHKIGFTTVKACEILSSLSCSKRLLQLRSLRPYMLVSPSAAEEFQGVATNNPNTVLMGLTTNINFDQMNTAFQLLMNGASLIAMHKARRHQTPDGLAIGPGAFVTALEYAADVKAEVVGKPSRHFFEEALSIVNCRAEEAVMIGDDVRDDVGGAQELGMRGILVQTGKYREGDEKNFNVNPNAVVASFVEAVEWIAAENRHN